MNRQQRHVLQMKWPIYCGSEIKLRLKLNTWLYRYRLHELFEALSSAGTHRINLRQVRHDGLTWPGITIIQDAVGSTRI
jgi:hypothetical protein